MEGKFMLLYPMYCAICKEIGMYSERRLKDGDDFTARDIILLNGSKPVDNIDEIFCGSCLIGHTDFFYKSDEPEVIVFNGKFTAEDYNKMNSSSIKQN